MDALVESDVNAPTEINELPNEAPIPNCRIRHVPNIVEFKRVFMEQANKVFEEQKANNKLTILKEENLNEIINTIKRWDLISHKTPLQFKWKKRFYILIYF